MPHSALNIACYFVNRSFQESEPISNMKLQKLVYIANGLYLASTGKVLIKERVEAWPYGPVVEPVYHAFKKFGNREIDENIIDCQLFFQNDFTAKEMEALKFTWDMGRQYSAIKLSNWSHEEDSPWHKAIQENSSIIPDEYIKEYFQKFLANG